MKRLLVVVPLLVCLQVAACADAEVNGTLVSAAINSVKTDAKIKDWCNGFLRGLGMAAGQLRASHSADILSAYTLEESGTVDDILNNPVTAACTKKFVEQLFQDGEFFEAYCQASGAKSRRVDMTERKGRWAAFRKIAGERSNEIVGKSINIDGQIYWHPCTQEDQEGGPQLFLKNNLHLKLTPDMVTALRAELPLYFLARAIQRANDLETDDQFAVLSKDAQQKWDGSIQ